MSRSVFTWTLIATSLLVVPLASAQDIPETSSEVTTSAKAPWEGSQISYTNAVSLLSLQRDAELTYNPYYAMTFGVVGQYNLTDIFYLQGRFALTRELTDSDVTTRSGETWVNDLTFRLGAASFYKIPVVGLAFSADLDIITPTSPTARARTLQAGLAPSVGISRAFDLLGGLFVAYNFRATHYFYEATTAQRELPLIEGCDGTLGGCGGHQNLGLRNAQWRLGHTFTLVSWFTKWMGLRAQAALYTDYLFDEATDSRVSFEPQADEDERFIVATDLALMFQPMPSLGIALGASTANPQLAPDSSREAPFFNRYTVVYLDLSLDVAGLVKQIQGE